MRKPRLRRWLSTGLGSFAITAAGSAVGQSPPPSPPKSVSAAPAAAGATLPAQAGAAVPVPGVCSCGHRHGVSRWWYHKTRCKRLLQECVLGYPEEFNEWPLGAALYAHGRTQVANGNAARMVFYQYDFQEGSGTLNLRGRDKLAKLARTLPISFAPIVIERTPKTPGLDEQRRGVVLSELASFSFPVPPERVVIGRPISAGLKGYEASIVYDGQINTLQSGGASGAGDYAGSAGLNAGGLSGSAVNSALSAGGGVGR